MAVLTIAEKIRIAKINGYLINIAIKKGGLNGGGIDVDLPLKIRNVRKSIEYRYALDPSDTTLEGVSNYMLSMCIYVNEARGIIFNPGTTPGTIAGTTPSPYQFIVDAGTSFIIDGQSSKTITSFIGYNLIFVRNGSTQNTSADGSGSYYSWSKTSGTFIMYPQAYTGDVLGLFPI